jgi:hypothetical protein
MPSSADILSPVSLTAATNEVRSPLSFLKNNFYPTDQTVPTVDIELSVIRDGRSMAPFVKRDGAGIMVGGDSEDFKIVKPAHIRIKRPMSPSDLLDKRRAGFGIHMSAGDLNAQMRAYLAREMSGMLRKIQNSEEWLCAQAITGVITYEAEDGVSFEVDFGRSASLVVTLSGGDLWTASTSHPKDDFLLASELINDNSEGIATDVILGTEARAAFLSNAEVLSLLDVNPAFVRNGQLDFTQTIRDDGALLLGVYAHSVRVWSYARQVTLPDELGGATEALIRSKYAEFLWRSPEAERVVYYGGIRDMKAIGAGRVLESRRFSKSWMVEDPSAQMLLIESNPLPCNRRPDTHVSMQVVA